MDVFSIIEKIFTSSAGSFGFVFALLTLAFFLTHYITKKVTEIRESHKNIKEENQRISNTLEKHAEKVDNHMDEIRKDISFLKATMDIYKNAPGEALAQSHSPVSLTEKGISVAEEIGADAMIASNWEQIESLLDSQISDKNAYDIQEFCIETATIELDKLIKPDAIEKVKNYAYNAGQPLAYYAPIFGIKIRDKYLERKGISVDEVDKHDPKKAS